MIKREVDILGTSNTNQGAVNVSTDGSQFTMRFSKPLYINGEDCTVSVKRSTIWYVTPNITNGTNSKLYFNYSTTDYEIDLDTGLYDFSGLRNAIAVGLGNLGLATDLFTLVSDDATQKTGFTFTATVVIDFTQTDTFRDILGWDSGTVSGLSGQTKYADNVAAFNVIDSFQIHADLVQDGLNINGQYSQTIATVNIPLGTSVGSQIIDTPFNPTKIDCSFLDKKKINSIKFWLTDQNGNAVNTRGEIWSSLISLTWYTKSST